MILYRYLMARCFVVTFVGPVWDDRGVTAEAGLWPCEKDRMDTVSLFGASTFRRRPYVIRHSVRVSSYQKLVHFLLISRLDINVICALHKANPNALSSSEHGAHR